MAGICGNGALGSALPRVASYVLLVVVIVGTSFLALFVVVGTVLLRLVLVIVGASCVFGAVVSGGFVGLPFPPLALLLVVLRCLAVPLCT